MRTNGKIDWNSEETISILSDTNKSLYEKSKELKGISIWYISRMARKMGINVNSKRSYHEDRAATNKERKQRYNAKFKKNKRKVIQLDKNGNYIRTFDRPIDAANEFGISVFALYACLNGKSNSSGGYKWEYKVFV